MNRPMKTCKNPECQKEFDDYISAKKKHCCDKCRARANYLKKEDDRDHLKQQKDEFEQQYQLVLCLKEHGVKPLPYLLLKQFEFKLEHFIQGKDGNGTKTLQIKNLKMIQEFDNLSTLIIKTVVATPKPVYL
jgi:hypothetical protein